MSIITGRGDDGDTDLMFGRRIAKTSLRVAKGLPVTRSAERTAPVARPNTHTDAKDKDGVRMEIASGSGRTG